jgi:G:T-mismatch repair DNA endonuclease (very short patch repair protein)
MKRKMTRDLRVAGASLIDGELTFSLYGGAENACGVVRFHGSNRDWLEEQIQRGVRFRDEETPVALLELGSRVVIVRDADVERYLEKADGGAHRDLLGTGQGEREDGDE